MKLTQTEWQIMNALWEHHPATARELSEQLPQDVDWAYTTIKTILSRLAAKGAVSESKRGNTSLYEPLVSRSGARESAISSLLSQAFGGAVEPLLNFLVNDRKLSAKQRRQLQQMLDEEDSKSRRS